MFQLVISHTNQCSDSVFGNSATYGKSDVPGWDCVWWCALQALLHSDALFLPITALSYSSMFNAPADHTITPCTLITFEDPIFLSLEAFCIRSPLLGLAYPMTLIHSPICVSVTFKVDSNKFTSTAAVTSRAGPVPIAVGG